MRNIPRQNRPGGLDSAKLTSRHLRWFAFGLALPLLAGIAAYKVLAPQMESAQPQLTPALSELSKQTIPELPLPNLADGHGTAALVKTVEFVVRRNDTMEKIFRQLQLSLQDLATVRQLPQVQHALEMLKPGERITFNHSDDGNLQGLTRRLNDTSLLSISREGDGFKAEVIETPLTSKVASVHGRVESSFYGSARAAGLNPELIMRLATDIFGWDIDFALEIQRGDEFSVVYEQQYREAEYVGPGRILAAEFVNDGHTYRAVRYESPDGKIANYFTPEGRSMRKQFLRAPVDFTRISSGFSLARLHPILNTIRAHKGVDYAAPTGTPIWAAGDGRVDFAGVKGGYGKVIMIEHGAGISTVYGHMSAFAKGVREGGRVHQGEVIGYVGSTGAATGPHLHYEYRVNGVHKNPRTVPMVNAVPISAEYLADFHRQADPHLLSLDRIARAEVTAGPVSR